jgi:hypothetical protein
MGRRGRLLVYGTERFAGESSSSAAAISVTASTLAAIAIAAVAFSCTALERVPAS